MLGISLEAPKSVPVAREQASSDQALLRSLERGALSPWKFPVLEGQVPAPRHRVPDRVDADPAHGRPVESGSCGYTLSQLQIDVLQPSQLAMADRLLRPSRRGHFGGPAVLRSADQLRLE